MGGVSTERPRRSRGMGGTGAGRTLVEEAGAEVKTPSPTPVTARSVELRRPTVVSRTLLRAALTIDVDDAVDGAQEVAEQLAIAGFGGDGGGDGAGRGGGGRGGG